MKLINFSTFTYLLMLSSIFTLFALPINASSCPNEDPRDTRSVRYYWRGNRCEGLLGYKLSGEPNLISLSIKNLHQFGQNITIQVKSPSRTRISAIYLESFLPDERYLLNNFHLDANGSFSWETSAVLTRANVSPESLWAIAKTADGVYLPVIIGSQSNQYEFVLRSNGEANFTKVEIYEQQSNKLIYKFSPTLEQPPGQPIIFRWNGRDLSGNLASAGRYKFVYEGYYKQRNAPPQPHRDSIEFEHNPSWLAP